jgi:hypothetical protein
MCRVLFIPAGAIFRECDMSWRKEKEEEEKLLFAVTWRRPTIKLND